MSRTIQLAIVACGVLAAAPARAQLCHPVADDDREVDDSDSDPEAMKGMHMEGMSDADMAAMHHAMHDAKPRRDPGALTARADLEVDVAQIDQGTYEGVVPSASLSWWRFDARVAVPYYHLEYRGVITDGPGDVLLGASGAIVAQRHLRAGVALAVTAGTGNGNRGTGMGDTMYMPGAWASWTRGAWGVTASGSYGRMASLPSDGSGHHHATGYVGSLVSPMNHEELAGALRGTLRATRSLRVHALASIATPIEIEGVTRAYAATGARWRSGDWEIGVEAALPITGDPFHARMSADVALSF